MAASLTLRIPGGTPARLRLRGLGTTAESFELRLFVNAPDADADTPTVGNDAYVGSVHVYGHGQTTPARLAAPRAATQRLKRDVEVPLPSGASEAAGERGLLLTLVPVDPRGRPLPADRISLDGVDPIP